MLAVLTCGLHSCSDDDVVQEQNGYGFVKLQLYKQGTRALLEGNELNKLKDAKKIELSLVCNGQDIKQTLNLYAVDETAAEFGLSSENLKLMAGEYTIKGYVIYGSYQQGEMAEILQVVTPDEEQKFAVQPNQLTTYNLYLKAVQYGCFSAMLEKLLPDMNDLMKRSSGNASYTDLFDYEAVDSVQLVFERDVNGTSYREDRKVKARKKSDEQFFRTDTIDLQAGNYKLIHYELFNKSKQFMYAEDLEVPFSVSHFQLTEQEVDVQIPESDALRDYIVLRQIWDKMDGKHWSWNGAGETAGSNWLFEFSDGSPRPIDAWGKQPGVVLNTKGRVISLNLGSFNPMGEVPDEIGQLQALEILYLGTHSEEYYGTTSDGMERENFVYDPYLLAKQGIDIRTHRMEIAKERTAMRRKSDSRLYHSRLSYKEKNPATFKYIRTYSQSVGDAANRITGISEKIGDLTNLNTLFIANAKITELPSSMSKLTNLTDLELFNLPLKNIDGEIFANMKQLMSVNISGIYGMTPDKLLESLEKLCEYCTRVQLLYLNDNKLTGLPEKLNRMTDLRMLDVAYNKINTLRSIQPIAPIQLLMDYNKLAEIPADFCQTSDLELCTITDNELKQFPAFLSNMDTNYTIEEIDLSMNKMHGFQEGFKGIRAEQLKMSWNEMGRSSNETGVKGEFPREFSDTKSEINYFVISANNIDTIKNAALKNMTYLQALDCSGNNLTDIPSGFNSENLPYLTGVEFSYNRFNDFPTNILNVSSITQLLLSSQGYFKDPDTEKKWVRSMTTWPENLHRHSSLKQVDFSGNDFRSVTNFPTNLNSLNVTDNPNLQMTIPTHIVYLINSGYFLLYYDEDQNITIEQ